ncbi:MAG: hypothetical protein KBT67_05865 [bacterium]|nr:hypothetical protein [Candidatus Limimorpha caballi]
MIISVANPIYDSVFKFLLEDERIVKTLISALLQREVKSVEVRKHEYTNGNRDKISMFRIDFGAQVLQDDGSYKLVLIELQKTWLETETLRFRQYLGTQYASADNMLRDDKGDSHGIPMVTVYLLGHRVGDIEEPILYVRHKSFDYYGNEVTKGLPDPFVESLVHDSIIVQIPLLRGQKNNRLEEVLSIFDQSNKDKRNAQVLNIEDDSFSGDADMERIVHRLLAAASNSKVRQDMNVEEEYFMAIEDRDTAIMARDEKIRELDLRVSEKEAQISEKEAQISEKDAQISEKDAQINEKDAQISEKDSQIDEKNQALMASAKALKKAGLSVDDIAEMTTLPVEVIRGL